MWPSLSNFRISFSLICGHARMCFCRLPQSLFGCRACARRQCCTCSLWSRVDVNAENSVRPSYVDPHEKEDLGSPPGLESSVLCGPIFIPLPGLLSSSFDCLGFLVFNHSPERTGCYWFSSSVHKKKKKYWVYLFVCLFFSQPMFHLGRSCGCVIDLILPWVE